MQRIYHDGFAWNFDEYFEYIEVVANQMPRSLRDFASNVDNYSLSGNNTLHDSRIISITISKNYSDDFSGGSTSIKIILIDQLFEGVITLEYKCVSSYLINEAELSSRLPVDIILHEFSVVRPGVYKHHIALDNDGALCIEFEGFTHGWNAIE